jgi:hypothetical protein
MEETIIEKSIIEQIKDVNSYSELTLETFNKFIKDLEGSAKQQSKPEFKLPSKEELLKLDDNKSYMFEGSIFNGKFLKELDSYLTEQFNKVK